jgi:hypothetical protein
MTEEIKLNIEPIKIELKKSDRMRLIRECKKETGCKKVTFNDAIDHLKRKCEPVFLVSLNEK